MIKKTVIVATLSLVMTVGIAGPAVADTPAGDQTLDALEYVTALNDNAATDILRDVAQVSAPEMSSGLAVDAVVSGNEITVPIDASTPLTYNGIDIELPFNDQTDQAISNVAGVTTFVNNNGTTSAAVVKADGSIQLLTVIEGSDAPARYDYPLGIPSDAVVDLLPGGGVLIFAHDGSLILGVAAPWAIDANGARVATHYEFSGNVLTQVVDHQGSNVAYPVVADPWMGLNIFQFVSSVSSTQKITAVVSVWGTAIHTGVAQGGGPGAWALGQDILKTAGWDELRAKAPIANNKATYRQQYNCHVVGAYTPFTGGAGWDLEGTRASKPNWLTTAATHKCNW